MTCHDAISLLDRSLARNPKIDYFCLIQRNLQNYNSFSMIFRSLFSVQLSIFGTHNIVFLQVTGSAFFVCAALVTGSESESNFA